ncbi:MAG: hypothetical protein RLZZ258_414 [Actinomycetota bacterium]|jgi:multiple sugar transport system permease protein
MKSDSLLATLKTAIVGRSLRAQSSRAGILFVLPAVFLLLLFLVLPVILAFTLGVTDAKLASPKPVEFIGLENFFRLFSLSYVEVPGIEGNPEAIFERLRELTKVGSGSAYEGLQILNQSISANYSSGSFWLAGDAVFWKSLINTLLFAAVVAPLQGGLALGLALLINSKIRGRVFFRTIYFFPVVTSMVVVSILWVFMYQEKGLVNNLLGFFIPAWEPIGFLAEPSLAMPAIMVMSIWQGVGFHMLIWLSGLQTISAELYEAAKVDGANAIQQFRHVTWPGLRTTFVFVLITISIQAMGLFTQVNVMTQGGPVDSTTTLVFHSFREGFRKQEVGYSAAIAVIFFLIVVTVSLIQRAATKDKD